MVMHEQSRRLSEPLRWTRAGRLAVIVVAVLLIGGTAAILSLSGAKKLAPGCIEVTFPSTLGAAVVHPCGARAREICARPGENPGLAEHGALREACGRARLPYGSG
ncbi:MAG TPA: hypothetical protein VGY30_06045 [Solirubrobacteraceae bacterium]|jgi:hypothetical protein|nr:hypothetical protein [Solirubrobacteraceae bacterium]